VAASPVNLTALGTLDKVFVLGENEERNSITNCLFRYFLQDIVAIGTAGMSAVMNVQPEVSDSLFKLLPPIVAGQKEVAVEP
jgi:hypothetical protein